MNKIKSILLLSFIVSISLSLLACQGDNNKPKKAVVRPVKSMVIHKLKTGHLRRFPGKVVASKLADLSFRVTGKLQKLSALEGIKVSQGELIAQLDPKPFQDKVDEAKAKFINQKAQYLRMRELVKGGYVAQATYDRKRSDYLVAKANLSVAERDLSYTNLYAPFAGYVAKRFVENHEFVKAKQSIISLYDLNKVDIEINVPEEIMLRLKKDRSENKPPVAIFNSVPNKLFKVDFKEFSSQADPETQTYRVVFIMRAPKEINVLPGMTVTIQAILPDFGAGNTGFFRIPSSAVFKDANNKTMVWLIDPNTMTIKKTPVEVSRLKGSEIEIVKGLKVNDRIVTAGVHFLKSGQKVRLLKEKKISD